MVSKKSSHMKSSIYFTLNTVLILLFLLINVTIEQQDLKCTKTRIDARAIYNCSYLDALRLNWTVLQRVFVSDLLLSSSINLNQNFQQIVNYINSLDSLILLDLSSNNLNEIDNGIALQSLDCNQNYLQTLILSSNNFNIIPILGPACMNNIKTLYMNNNKNLANFDRIVNPNNNTFDSSLIMSSLQYLDVSNCNIETLNQYNQTILKYMPNIISLNLRNNRIKTIIQSPFIFTPNLLYVNMDSNSFDCNYDLLWFKYYLLQRQLYYLQLTNSTPYDLPDNSQNQTYSPKCTFSLLMLNNSVMPPNQQTPPILLTQLDDYLFFTSVQLNSSIINRDNIQIDANNNLDLDCQVDSVPESNILWTFGSRELSRIVNNDGNPYLFIDSIVTPSQQQAIVTPNGTIITSKNRTKLSILRILNINSSYAGQYSCRTYYQMDSRQVMMTRNFIFNVNVKQPIVTPGLTTGEILGIIFGCIIGFLLFLIILALLIYFICYKNRICCFKPGFKSKILNKKSSNSSSNKYFTNKNFSSFNGENNAGGFHDDVTYTKPNYVLSSASQGSYLGVGTDGTTAVVAPAASNATTTTNTITNSSIKSLQFQQQPPSHQQQQIRYMYNNDTIDDSNATMFNNDNVYNVSNSQKYYILQQQQQQQQLEQQQQQQKQFDNVYLINDDFNGIDPDLLQLQQQQQQNYKTISMLNNNNNNSNAIYYPQQQYPSQHHYKILQEDIVFDSNGNSNIDDLLQLQQLQQLQQFQQQQQQQSSNYVYQMKQPQYGSNLDANNSNLNNSFIKYDSDV